MSAVAATSWSQPSWAAAIAALPDLDLRWNEPLARHTTFRLGAPVACLAQPRSIAALQTFVRRLRHEGIAYFLLGAGSNLLASDELWDGVAIQLGQCCGLIQLNPSDHETEMRRLGVGAGVKLSRLLRFSLQYGLTGFEPLIGIPGTVGGAVVMNAGTSGGSITDVLDTITIMEVSGERCEIPKSQLEIGYRSVTLPERSIILESSFSVAPTDPKQLRTKLQAAMRQRRQTQPLSWPSAGCIFKNPPGYSAGALIDQAGLKGLRSGDAEISSRHGNWIVNLGHASARDVLTLVRIAEERVFKEFGIHLEREIRVLGG
jgi:UDP-N-acetylmuramate dehydrogenase